MAKPAPKDEKKKAPGTGGGIAAILPMLGFATALVSSVLLTFATLDFKFFDLRPSLQSVAPVLSFILIAGASICFFSSVKNAASRHKALPDTLAALRSELDAIVAAQKAALDDAASAHRAQTGAALKETSQKVEAFVGAEHGRLKDENDRLRSQLDGLQRQDAEKAAEEINALRQKNAELEERITQWAVGSIESRIERKTLQAA